MILARRTSAWTSSYELELDGGLLVPFERSAWRTGGTLVLDGRTYEVRSNLWSTGYDLVTDDGVTVASARRVGRKSWTVEADGVLHQFRRVSGLREEEELTLGGQPVGSVRRTGSRSGETVANLPGMPTPVAVFAVAVVLCTWDASVAPTT